MLYKYIGRMDYEALHGIDGSRYKIMVVDDIPINTRLLEKILEKANFQLSIFNNSQQALDNLAEVNPDIILLDVMMPGIDGITFLTRVREDHNFDHIRIIMVSAVSEAEEILRTGSLGANDYITKPINSKSLTYSIANQIKIIEGNK